MGLVLSDSRTFGRIPPNFAWLDLFLPSNNGEILLFEANLLPIVVFISVRLKLVQSIDHKCGVLLNLIPKSVVELFAEVGSPLVSSAWTFRRQTRIIKSRLPFEIILVVFHIFVIHWLMSILAITQRHLSVVHLCLFLLQQNRLSPLGRKVFLVHVVHFFHHFLVHFVKGSLLGCVQMFGLIVFSELAHKIELILLDGTQIIEQVLFEALKLFQVGHVEIACELFALFLRKNFGLGELGFGQPLNLFADQHACVHSRNVFCAFGILRFVS